MISFDTSTIASQTAALVARCDYGQFLLTSSSTLRTFVAHQFAELVPAVTNSRLLVSWVGTYRTIKIGESIVCDAGNLPLAQVALLVSAQQALDLLDQRLTIAGVPQPPG